MRDFMRNVLTEGGIKWMVKSKSHGLETHTAALNIFSAAYLPRYIARLFAPKE